MSAHFRNGFLPVALVLTVAALSPDRGAGQSPGILASEVTVSGDEASLRLSLSGGEALAVTLRAGRLLVNGSEAGRFQPGGSLDASWRALLAQAIALDATQLPSLLLAWEAPEALPADAAESATEIRARLGEALESRAPTAASPTFSFSAGAQDSAALEALIREPGRLRELAAAVSGIRRDELRVHFGESVRIEEGETVTGTVVSLEGDLQLDGTVDGDLVLVGGAVALGPRSRVTGDLRWVDARISGERSAVAGRIEEVAGTAVAPTPPPAGGTGFGIGEEIRREIREATQEVAAAGRQVSSRRDRSALGQVGRGIAGLFRTVVTFGILLGAGLGLLYFFPRQLEVVARTARTTTGRSALVGVAGVVLAMPVWVVGTVLLAVSIIGIPALLLWIPVYPLVLAVALSAGYLAVARNLGRWISDREIRALGGVDTTRPAVHIAAGLIVLLSAFALASLFRMGGPWFGVFQGILLAAGLALTLFAFCVGLGAVILSRGGRNPAFAGPGWGPLGDEDVGHEGSAGLV